MQNNEEMLQKFLQMPELVMLPVHSIVKNPDQPRMITSDKKLAALAESIGESGVLQPVLVCLHKSKYTLIAGHRRHAAAILAGLLEIPAIELTGQLTDYLGAQLTENMLRHDLCTLEIAMFIGKMADSGVARSDLCKLSGLSLSSLCELLRINKIPTDVLEACAKNGNTTKRFLNQLSLVGDEQKIREAYFYYEEHKELPPRQKRAYSSKKAQKNQLSLLNKLNLLYKNKQTVNSAEEGDMADMIRKAIVELQNNMKNDGWILP
jgi:ParB/RepB/Spo0J family partition protein